MGVYNAELFNNLGLCCFYAQQYDHVISCFERAISLSTDETMADIWYNISHIALVCIQFLLISKFLIIIEISFLIKISPYICKFYYLLPII